MREIFFFFLISKKDVFSKNCFTQSISKITKNREKQKRIKQTNYREKES